MSGKDREAILMVGHGSRDPEGLEEFRLTVDLVRERKSGLIVEKGFLEFAQPTILEGLERCLAQGARRLIVLPGMLFVAGHVKSDIPGEIDKAAHLHPDATFILGRPLHIHPNLLELAQMRIEEAEARFAPRERDDALLLLVGRGSSDPEANSDVFKVARILCERIGFGWAETCFIGVTYPLLDEALERVVRLGFGRVVVLPYFMFTGLLVKRIIQTVDEAAARHPEVEWVQARHLGAHPLMAEVFIERALEAMDGSAETIP